MNTLEPKNQSTQRSVEMRWYRALSASTLIHTIVIVLAALYVMSDPPPNEPGILDSRWSQQGESLKEDFDQVVEIDPTTVEGETESMTATPVAVDTTVTPPKIELREVVTGAVPTIDSSANSQSNWSDVVAPLATGPGNQGGFGEGGQFFGQSSNGKRFAFIVDSSQSMNHPHQSRAKTRLGRVKLELVQAISAMEPQMEFFVIFFNDGALPMPSRHWVASSSPARKRMLNWIVDIEADGKTDPTHAVRLALQLRPDVIYFLTDGEFEVNLAQLLTAANRRGVTIHTFCLGQRDSEPMLRNIALANGGHYRFIP